MDGVKEQLSSADILVYNLFSKNRRILFTRDFELFEFVVVESRLDKSIVGFVEMVVDFVVGFVAVVGFVEVVVEFVEMVVGFVGMVVEFVGFVGNVVFLCWN